MPLIAYQHKRFSAKSAVVIRSANQIIAEYAAQGFTLSLRQIYYQHVARGLLPNAQKEYKRLGDIISDARMAGLIDWEAIVDRTRHVRQNSHWSGPSEIVRSAAKQFQIDKWEGQPEYCEVYVEKDALIGVIEPVCSALDVPCLSCRGYASQSEVWSASQRLLEHVKAGQKVTVFHLSDHDPSGIDMSRDLQARFDTFADWMGDDEQKRITVQRIALTMQQVRQYNPPPNPAKETDSRITGYRSKFGSKSWELDALDPKTLTALINKHVKGVRDQKLWNAKVFIENEHKAELEKIAAKLAKKEGEDDG